jgi:hypothetical protein
MKEEPAFTQKREQKSGFLDFVVKLQVEV